MPPLLLPTSEDIVPNPDDLKTVDEIDFLDPHISSNPYRAFELLQRECPVYQLPGSRSEERRVGKECA